MCVLTHGCIYLSINPSVRWSGSLFLFLSLCLSVGLSGCLAGWLAGCLSVCLAVWLSVCLSVLEVRARKSSIPVCNGYPLRCRQQL